LEAYGKYNSPMMITGFVDLTEKISSNIYMYIFQWTGMRFNGRVRLFIVWIHRSTYDSLGE